MAHWVNNEPQSTRRKWNLGDRTSLRNVLGNSSEDCNSNSHYEIARRILEDDSHEDSRADYSLGIDWLLKASYEGHEGAIMLLSKSLKTGRGINDRNIAEVETCLAMTPAERSARKAARELFNCLANGEQHITVAQLERKMRQIYKLKSCRNRDDQYSHAQNVSPYHTLRRNVLSNPADNITEAHLITAAMNYSNGQLPAISSSLTLSIPHPDSLNHIPYFHRLLFHPLMFMYLIYHKYLNVLAKFPGSMINCLLFILLLSYTTTISNVLFFMPVTFYYISLFVMVVATFKMFRAKHNFDDFQMWSRLFLSFDQHVDTDASENQFLRKEMQPYLIYFSAFFANVIISPTIPLEWKLSSEITLTSFVLLFVTMFVFTYNNRYRFPDILQLLSFGINVLAKYPYEMDAAVSSGWRFLDMKIPNFSPFLIGDSIEFCFNCRALLYLMIPGLLIMLARRQNWHGIYQCLIPHCVTLSWLQICIISSQSATMFELIRGTLGLAGLIFCLPLFGVVTLMIPVFAAVDSLSFTSTTARLIASLCIAAIALIVSCFLASYRRTKKYITILQITICLVATFYVAQPYLSKSFESADTQSARDIYQSLINNEDSIESNLHQDDDSLTNLKYDLFNRYCRMPIMNPGNRINAQLKCEQFNGIHIKWEGTVTNVEINQVFNLRSNLLSYLPELIASPITCWFGEPNELLYDVYEPDELDYLKTIFKEQNKCNLNIWNTYEYRIGIKMDYNPTDIYLIAPSTFANFTKFINRLDRVWFKGSLQLTQTDLLIENEPKIVYDLEKYPPMIDLTAIGCISCQHAELKTVFAATQLKLSTHSLYSGFKYLLNVLFNPLIKIN